MSRKWNSSTKGKAWKNEYTKRYNRTTKGIQSKLNTHLQRTYGLTLDQYNNLLKAQNNKCAICLQAGKKGERLSVDHSHKTGRVRGLLCRNCNAALGLLHDSADRLILAYNYLKHTG